MRYFIAYCVRYNDKNIFRNTIIERETRFRKIEEIMEIENYLANKIKESLKLEELDPKSITIINFKSLKGKCH
jgi:hypothetical protein